MKLFNILMIDDDPDDHDFFCASLKDVRVEGFRVAEIVRMTSAYNGKQGLDYLYKKGEFKNNKDVLPDFIVLDLNMPITVGYSVLMTVSNDPSLNHIPVYVLTTSRDDSQKDKCLDFKSCAGFFSKPSARKEVIPIIEKMLNIYSA